MVPMATSVASTKKTVVMLNTPSDWHLWIAIVNNKASFAEIEKFVDLSSPEAPAPLEEPVKPQISAINKDAKTTDDLKTPYEQTLHQIADDDYEREQATYQKKVAAIAALRSYILSTVSRPHRVYIRNKETPWLMLKALKLRLDPTKRAHELELLRQYRELQKGPRGQELEAWIMKYDNICTQMESADVPCVQGDVAIFDFLGTIKAVDPSYATFQEILLYEDIRKKKPVPSLFEQIADFRNHYRLKKIMQRPSALAAFPGDDDKRQTSGSWTKPCVCREIHPFRACPYLIEQRRTSDWVPDPAVQRKIISTLSKSDTLREAVEHAQRRARNTMQSQTKPIASRSRSIAKEQKSDEIETPTPRTTRTLSHTSFFAGSAFITASPEKLKNSWILSSITTTHICNDYSRFKFERKASPSDSVYSGTTECQIEAFGSVLLTVNTPSRKSIITLQGVALVPGYFTNLISLSRFAKKGVHWDTEKQHLHHNGKTFCTTFAVDQYWVLEDPDAII